MERLSDNHQDWQNLDTKKKLRNEEERKMAQLL
jgi:hypothetical protein